ncbi:MAG: glycerol-3-phosphate dehydrogenase/oxidase [Chloroflexi bacterium]|nr:glycerol-3-phosphate dehydrogenase/oxidase [Chloroflexota bacterium]
MTPLEQHEAGTAGLDGQRFDAVVIGGGILGAGVARELSRRGQRPLLVERRDFSWGTTARSTRLIHGGLRYLANYDLGLVREGLRERAWLLRSAPNLVTPLLFLLPFHGTPAWERLRLRAGLSLYDVLSPRGSLPRHRMLSPTELIRLEPALSRHRLLGAASYWDAQVELPERLVLGALRAAADAGAEIRNHVAATGLVLERGGVSGVRLAGVLDGEEATVGTWRVVNASGPWADVTLDEMGITHDPILRLTQGIHLVYPRLAEHAVAFEHPADGRLCFAIPWQGQTMVGTTETDLSGAPDDARVLPREVEYLQEAVALCFPGSAGVRPLWGSVGVRSLMRKEGIAGSISRRHLVIQHTRDGAAGLLTVAGGKLTAWRSISADVVDVVLGEKDRSALRGAVIASGRERPRLPSGLEASAGRLWRIYGARAEEVASLAAEDPWWSEPLLPGRAALRAEVPYAVQQEWAQTLGDVVLRRLALGFGADLGRAAAEAVAEVAVAAFGWDRERAASELRAFDAENAERRLPEQGPR